MILGVQDQSMAFGSDRSRFTDIHFTGKRYAWQDCFDSVFYFYNVH